MYMEDGYMDYQKELEKFSVFTNDYPKYENSDKFSKNFHKCSVYRYENTSYSNYSHAQINRENTN